MDLKVPEKELEELTWKASTLEYMEKFIERNRREHE